MPTQHTIDTPTRLYEFDPKVAFATTRAGAERRRQATAIAARDAARGRSPWFLICRLANRRSRSQP